MNQLLLSFDTSTPRGSVALVSESVVVGEVSLDVKHRPHSDYLLRHAHFLLQESGVTLADITGLCVVNGPGSFTGLRVGLATVQGLAQSLELPVYQISSLLVLGFMYGRAPCVQYCLLDARKQELYGALLQWGANGPRVEQMFVLPPAAICEHINAHHASEPVILIGHGAEIYHELFQRECNADLYFSGSASQIPSAADAVQLLLQWPGLFPPVQVYEIQAQYVRPSDAELQQRRGRLA
ncbi:MAG: tRNA (adenosine(37)-N6)-threonylcarbamoyltransferase complex dimerization subunit type 1 TsaB [Geobacteraceae bacterium]|nr:tRNA (adenosine(37)-N6)-threonylcarbamoyltransferase complex dimerization subunit type 1 TsaB [Geobacteraceae bacterium]